MESIRPFFFRGSLGTGPSFRRVLGADFSRLRRTLKVMVWYHPNGGTKQLVVSCMDTAYVRETPLPK